MVRGFVERAHHPGNVFFPQAEAATAVYDLLDGSQQESARVTPPPEESDVTFVTVENRRGLSLATLSPDQLEEAGRLLGILVEPFRAEDQAAVRVALAACSLSFFEPWYRRGDDLWDCFRLEGRA